LTARGSWAEKVQGIDAGADDYLAKPFQTEELLARLRALIRRAHGHAKTELTCEGVTLDTGSGKVTVNGSPVDLSAHEYRVLRYLMHRKGQVVSRSELVEHIYAQDFARDSNTIEVFVARLRRPVGAVLATLLALAAAGTVLAALFRAHVERRLDAELAIQLEQIAAALERPGTEKLILTHQPSDPRFRKPYSGFYWQVDNLEGPIFRSRSLWDVALRLPLEASPDGQVHRHRISGPEGQWLIALERTVTVPDVPA